MSRGSTLLGEIEQSIEHYFQGSIALTNVEILDGRLFFGESDRKVIARGIVAHLHKQGYRFMLIAEREGTPDQDAG